MAGKRPKSIDEVKNLIYISGGKETIFRTIFLQGVSYSLESSYRLPVTI